MSRRSFVTEHQLAQARRALDIAGVADTTEFPSQEIINAALRRRLAARMRSGEGIDRGEQVLEASRRWHR